METILTKDTSKHPCFNKESKGSCGRVHLPVAPKCNIQCNYCNRKYDCVNESRPGVSSAVLSPHQAVAYMDKVLEREPRITVAGIAGPGDPMANPEAVLETMRLLKEKYPQLLFCLSSNGLAMPEYLDDLVSLGVSHATVTMNAIDPEVAQNIYSWVRDGKIVYHGRKAAELLIQRQLESIEGLVKRGLATKVNTIIIPGVNDHHIPEVSRKVGELGATIMNCLPIKPTCNTPFEDIAEPSKAMVKDIRAHAEKNVAQMTHCKRCRADAVGLLGCDLSGELAPSMRECARMEEPKMENKPYVAIATREGMLVNQHLGEASSFQIWGESESGFTMVEERPSPKPGTPQRWKELCETLSDCRAVLVSAYGETPGIFLKEYGIEPIDCSGFIQEALTAVYTTGNLDALKGRKRGIGGSSCGGCGTGCG